MAVAGTAVPPVTAAAVGGMGVGAIGQTVQMSVGSAGEAPKNAIPQKALDTLDTVKKTGAAPKGYEGGRTFLNDGRGGGQVLPKTAPDGTPIAYKEFDVMPYTKGVNRGAQRVVVGSDGKAYYTNDHYTTFTEIP